MSMKLSFKSRRLVQFLNEYARSRNFMQLSRSYFCDYSWILLHLPSVFANLPSFNLTKTGIVSEIIEFITKNDDFTQDAKDTVLYRLWYFHDS